MKKVSLLLSIVLLFALTSCGINSKEDYMKSFDSFVAKVEKKKEMTKEEYQKISERFEEYTKKYYDKYKDQLSAQELTKVAEMKARYAKTVTENHLEKAGDAIKKAGKDAEKAIKKAGDKASDAIKDVVE